MKRDAFSTCHPATNFLFFVGAIGFSVVIRHPLYVLTSLICAVLYSVQLTGRKAWRMLVGILPLGILVALVNPLFNTQGQTPLFTVFSRPYTLEALLYGAVIGAMLVLMMVWFSCYSAVLTSDKFTSLFASLIPALSMLLVMVLRLIPSLMRKAQQIALARRSIGKGVGEGSEKKEKLTAGMQVLSALTDWALEGSIVTADSMRARGYGTAKRSSFQIYRMSLRDGGILALMAVLCVAVIVIGGTSAEFTPQLTLARPTLGLVAYTVFLLIPSAMNAKEALTWHILRSRIEKTRHGREHA